MNKTKIVLSILALLFGVFMVVFGGMDDSPGAQLIGVIAIVVGIAVIFKNKKKHFK